MEETVVLTQAQGCPSVTQTLSALTAGSVVVDVGCFGWLLSDACRSLAHRLVGVDRAEPPGRPQGVEYACIAGQHIDVPDDRADLTVASHVLEHRLDPVPFFAELVRITRPGGWLWIEAPSELAAQGRSSDDAEDHAFHSFWDDPTHVRPWTPGALYRLALSCYACPAACARVITGGIPSVRLLAFKPSGCSGAPPTRYVTLKGVTPGLASAWSCIWQEDLPCNDRMRAMLQR